MVFSYEFVLTNLFCYNTKHDERRKKTVQAGN